MGGVPDSVPSLKKIGALRKEVLEWFEHNRRDYPWRRTSDPFKILIAEMMLRRTKANQVERVYSTLFEQYPDVDSIAKAPEEELERILRPLGLKWRTPAFWSVAREIKERYNCKVPSDRRGLTALPGVGEYVAGAVLSIAYGKGEWIVDTNIVRLFRRYFGIKTSKEGRRDKHVIAMAKAYASGPDPRTANLAVLDFTALVCIPRRPLCKECPLRRNCYYLRLAQFPTHRTS